MDNRATPKMSSPVLQTWEEIVGELIKIEERQGKLIVQLSTGTLTYDSSSTESDIIRNRLAGEEGALISILRMDSIDKPILINFRD